MWRHWVIISISFSLPLTCHLRLTRMPGNKLPAFRNETNKNFKGILSITGKFSRGLKDSDRQLWWQTPAIWTGRSWFWVFNKHVNNPVHLIRWLQRATLSINQESGYHGLWSKLYRGAQLSALCKLWTAGCKELNSSWLVYLSSSETHERTYRRCEVKKPSSRLLHLHKSTWADAHRMLCKWITCECSFLLQVIYRPDLIMCFSSLTL